MSRRPRSLFFALSIVAAVSAFAGCAPAVEDSEEGSSYVSSSELKREAERLRAEATKLAGEPSDIPQRVVFLHEIYVDSKGNHAFPEVALHGALWAHDFFRATSLLENVGDLFKRIGNVAALLETADEFKVAIETTNRQVFIDTYTNYWLTKKYRKHPELSEFVDGDVLPSLLRVQEATATGKPLSADEKREIFLATLNTEQKESVARMMDEAAKNVDPAWFKKIVNRPVLRFTYFPGVKFYAFRDFSNRVDRVACATYAYDVAAEVGFDKVTDAMDEYSALPDAYFADRKGYAAKLRAALLGR